LPSPYLTALVMSDRNWSSFIYRARSVACDHYQSMSISGVSQVISVPWHLVRGQVFVSYSGCDQFYMDSFGSTPTSTSFSYYVKTHPNAHLWNSFPPFCPVVGKVLRNDPQAAGVTVHTHHGWVGVQRQLTAAMVQPQRLKGCLLVHAKSQVVVPTSCASLNQLAVHRVKNLTHG
jgi:hypothetical protein